MKSQHNSNNVKLNIIRGVAGALVLILNDINQKGTMVAWNDFYVDIQSTMPPPTAGSLQI
jgi:hypothetical protein